MQLVEPMLARRADPARLVELCQDDNFGAQQKIDGDRLLIHVEDGVVRPVSRNHNTLSGVKRHVLQEFSAMQGRWVFDGEFFAGCFHVFDLVEGAGRSFASEEFGTRYATLEHFFAAWNPSECIKLLPLALTHQEKCDLAEWTIQNQAEGLVMKDLRSLYKGGRSDQWLKIKWRNDAEFLVTEMGRGGHRNMALAAIRDGQLVDVGECTALAGDGPRVKAGDVVQVTYQYVSKAGRLVQPTMPKLRPDKTAADCQWSQLVFKNDLVREATPKSPLAIS